MFRTRLGIATLVISGTLLTASLQAQEPATEFSAGYSEWAADRPDRAAAIFDAAARRQPPSSLSLCAFIAVAKVRLAQGRLEDALRSYDALLMQFPDYHLPANCRTSAAFTDVDMMKGANVCLGSVVIAERAAAIRAQRAALKRAARVQADPNATAGQKAPALFDAGRQWERTDAVDGPSDTPAPHTKL
jgi:tetratricopeptide (TPR) repeat protein